MLTWAGLVAAMISRYGFGNEVQWFFVAGLSHGIVFLAYALTALVIGINLRWGFGLTLVAVMVAIVPFATVPLDRWLLRKNKLKGDWATMATTEPAPAGFLDRLVRFWVGHPGWFFALIVVGMGALLTVLLTLGSPTEWGNG
jgi:integral membrane protein